MKQPKVAIVHDWLYGGGAEMVVLELHKMFPEAPIYTSYCTDEWRKKLHDKVITGYLQKWPFNKLRKFLPLLRQWWFASLDLSDFELVISSSGNGEAKFVRPSEKATHVCYCHSPTHFYWRKYEQYLNNPGFKPEWLARFGLKMLLKPLRRRDYQAAQRVDHFIANSTHIQADIKRYYKRDSVVIHPPIDTGRFSVISKSKENKDGFIIWSRHVPYKRFDLAIKACNQLKEKLVVVGEGPETKRLMAMAGPTIFFAGRAPDDELDKLAAKAEAFLFPGEEDFGISPVEAMAAGLPVIAFKAGGALDYVEPGITGEFITRQSAHELAKAIARFSPNKYNPRKISSHALQFSTDTFRKKLAAAVKSHWPAQ